MGNRLFLYFLFSNYGDGNYFVLKKREGWHWPGSQFVPEDEVEVVEVSAVTVVTIATASTDVMLGIKKFGMELFSPQVKVYPQSKH